MTTTRLTTVCGSCGNVLWEDEAAGHHCNPRRIAELEWRVADLERQLTAALRAFDIAKGIREGRDMITPGTTHVCDVVPLSRATRPAQVTARPRRTASGTPGRASYARVSPFRRAPAGGVA